MLLEWVRTDSGALSAVTNPFRAYMKLHDWAGKHERGERYLEAAKKDEIDLPEETRKRLQENVLGYDRLARLYPEIEIRITNDGFSCPRFTPTERTYEPIKRVEFHLHFTPSIGIPGHLADVESLPLWDWFHVLSDDEQKAKKVSQALAAILPGTRIADPEWVLELDRRLCVDRYALRNLPAFRTPLRYLEDIEPVLQFDFELARGAAQEASTLIENPAFSCMVNPLGLLKDHARAVFDKRSSDSDPSETRRSIMVQNAVMCHVQDVMPASRPHTHQRYMSRSIP